MLLVLLSAALASPAWVQFDNELTLASRHTDTPEVSVALVVDVGWSNDGDSPGVAHLAEHLWFRSTAADGRRMWDALRARGCAVDATTHQDETRFTTTCPAEDAAFLLEETWRWLLDPLRGVDEDALVLETAIVLQEQRERALLHPWKEPLYTQLLADPQPVLDRQRIHLLDVPPTLDTVRGWVQDHWTPAATSIAVVGPVEVDTLGDATPFGEPHAAVRRVVEPEETPGEQEEPRAMGPAVQLSADVPRGLLVYGWRLPAWADHGGLASEAASHLQEWLSFGVWGKGPGAHRVGCTPKSDPAHPMIVCVVEAQDEVDKALVDATRSGLRFSMAGPGTDSFLKGLDTMALGDPLRFTEMGADPEQVARVLARQLSMGFPPWGLDVVPKRKLPRKVGKEIARWLNLPNAARVVVHPSGTLPEATHLAAPTVDAVSLDAEPMRAEYASPATAMTTLDSGLRVVAIQRPGHPTVDVRLRFLRGTAVKTYGSAGLIERWARSPGIGVPGAVATWEHIRPGHVELGASGLEKELRGMLKLMAKAASERENGLGTTPGASERLQTWIAKQRAALEERTSTGSRRASRWLGRQVTPQHAPSMPMSDARLTTLEGLSPVDGASHGRRVWRPDNAVVVVTGPMEPSAALAQVSKAFRRWKTEHVLQPPAWVSPAVAALPGGGRVFDDPLQQGADVHLRCRLSDGVSGPTSQWVERLMRARLWESLRSQRGLVYTPFAWAERWPDGTSTLDLFASTHGQEAVGMVSTMTEVLARPVLAAEHEALSTRLARDRLRTHDADTLASEAFAAVREEADVGRSALERIRSVSLQEGQEVLQFCRDTLSWTLVAPTKQLPAEDLAALGDVQIEYTSGTVIGVSDLQ